MLNISRIPFLIYQSRLSGRMVIVFNRSKEFFLFFGGYVMKKRLVAYLMVSALAVTVLAGCGGKGDAAGDAADAATGEAAVVEEDAFVEEDDAAAALTAAIEEAAAVADTGAAVAAAADTAADAAEEYVDDEDIAAAATTVEAAAKDAAEKVEDLIVDPGTYYTVRFGGEVFGTPDESTPAIDYVYPDYTLLINERLDDYWYAVSYIIDGVTRTGYIKIQ